jgi:hypothetical protein
MTVNKCGNNDLSKQPYIKQFNYLGGDSRNFANVQIVNETANTMLQQ